MPGNRVLRSASVTEEKRPPHPSAHHAEHAEGAQADDDISPAELRYGLELGCWTTLALAPLLYAINGPAVSEDQFVVRTALVVLAACGAVGMRTYAWLRRPPS